MNPPTSVEALAVELLQLSDAAQTLHAIGLTAAERQHIRRAWKLIDDAVAALAPLSESALAFVSQGGES